MPALSPGARGRLLRLARAAIEARLAGRPAPAPPDLPELSEPRGAFVSLHRRADGALRGCVGYAEALYPLAEAVTRAAVLAATADERFSRLTLEELPEVVLDISVLTPPRPIAAPEVTVGVHGLLVQHGGRRGLLLPQVAVEQAWSREQFLDATCRKAGLEAGCWRVPEVGLLAFEAEVFRECSGTPLEPES